MNESTSHPESVCFVELWVASSVPDGSRAPLLSLGLVCVHHPYNTVRILHKPTHDRMYLLSFSDTGVLHPYHAVQILAYMNPNLHVDKWACSLSQERVCSIGVYPCYAVWPSSTHTYNCTWTRVFVLLSCATSAFCWSSSSILCSMVDSVKTPLNEPVHWCLKHTSSKNVQGCHSTHVFLARFVRICGRCQSEQVTCRACRLCIDTWPLWQCVLLTVTDSCQSTSTSTRTRARAHTHTLLETVNELYAYSEIRDISNTHTHTHTHTHIRTYGHTHTHTYTEPLEKICVLEAHPDAWSKHSW